MAAVQKVADLAMRGIKKLLWRRAGGSKCPHA
jgi:hypothetical protein